MTDQPVIQPPDGERRAVVWHCDPPGRGVLFVVTREGWTLASGREIRDIYAVKILGDNVT